MASLEKLKRKKGIAFRIRYRFDGEVHREYLPIDTSFTEAKALLFEFNHRIARHKANINKFISPLANHQLTLNVDDFHNWFTNHKTTAVRRGSPISNRTNQTYDMAFSFLKKTIGNISLNRITEHLIEIEKALSPYSPATKSIIIRSLRAAWNFGMKHNKVYYNPFLKVEISREQKLPDILTIDEKDKIFNQIRDPQLQIAFSLGRYSGLRRHEIVRNIRWDDILWEENLLNIPHAKTGENQKVPLHPTLKNILLQHKKESGYLVDMHPDTLTHKLGAAIRKVGIKKIGAVHILRHSLGADLRDQGIDSRDIQDFLRHSSITTTELYTQLSKKRLQERISQKVL